MLLCGLQFVTDFFEHLFVVGAPGATHVADGRIENVIHFWHNVDLAYQFWRRIKPNSAGVDVASVNGGIDHRACCAPLPRNRVVATLVPIHIHPAFVHILEVFHLIRTRFQQQTFLDPDRHEIS